MSDQKSPEEKANELLRKERIHDEERATLNAFSAHALTGILSHKGSGGTPPECAHTAEMAFNHGKSMLHQMRKFKAEQESTS